MARGSALRPLRHRLEADLLKGLAAILRALPVGAWFALGRILGAAGFTLLRSRRRVALENLRRAFPGRPEAELCTLGRASFQRLAWTFLEVLGGALRPERRSRHPVRARGTEVLAAALAEGRGVVLVASHLGNWELLGAMTAQLGFPHLTVGKPLRNPHASRWIEAERRRAGMDLVWADAQASMRLMDRLEQGGIASLVTDQDARSKGVAVRFLGVPASAHRGAALLALLADAPVVLASIVRSSDGRSHEIEYTRVAMPERCGRMDEDVARWTQAYTDLLSERILRDPADYLWAHNRFKHTREQG